MRFHSLLILAVLGLASPAQSATEDKKSANPEDKVVCKGSRDLAFGSHRRAGKVCKTEAEWKELEKGTQRELRAFQERSKTLGDAKGR